MEQITYTMQFTGQAGPMEGSPTTLKVRTTSPSCVITSVSGPDGLSSSIKPGVGEEAVFESQVDLTGESSFNEFGTIAYGKGGNSLRFSTVGEGYLGPAQIPK